MDSREKVKLSISRFPLEDDQSSGKRVEGKTQHSIQVGWRSDNLRLGDAGHFTCMNRTIILNITGTYKTNQRKEIPRTYSKEGHFHNFLDKQCEWYVFWSDIASH